MSRKRCNRRVWALVNPLIHAIEGASITPDHALDSLRTRELAAIEAFARGNADIDAWSDINLMTGMCETMARAGVGKAEVAATCEAVTQALQDAKTRHAKTRHAKTRRMGTTGPGLQAMRDLYAYHDLQRTSISRSEYEAHIAKLTRQIKQKSPKIHEGLVG